MSPIEMARVVAVVVFLAAAAYSAARFAWSVTRRESRAGVADLSHAAMGLAMALMVSPAGPAIPAPLGIAAFTVLAAWFAARLRRDGLLSRATLPAAPPGAPPGAPLPARPADRAGTSAPGPLVPGPARAGRPGRLTDLTSRDQHTAGHGGYHLHHLVGCAAMVVMYVTGHGALAADAIAATAATAATTAATAATTATAAAQDVVALDTYGAHATMPALAALSWVFGLYFLVAATSLGFRVGEPAPNRAHHACPAPPAAAPSPTAARLLSSPAGACAIEVALSAGMAVLFFSAL